ncbi:MAG: hypothetical protein IPH31_25175 [Lewinellaceae bacterium]|nr:hypothetical protein [Lewinellaceae bacterium]
MKKVFLSARKPLLLLCMLIPFVGMSQTKNVLSTHRVFPKIDKVLEFEKALSAHAQKYHTGDVKWRVFEIQSGPDMGGYHITEGPNSWEGLDTRGNLGEEHNIDWHKNVAMYLTDRQSAGYSVYEDTLSTIAVGDFTDKIQIDHVYPKLGSADKVRKILAQRRKVWQANGNTVAVYSSNASGPAQFAVVSRLKQGLKEKTPGFRKPFKATYEGIFGEDAFEDHVQTMREYTNEVWSEMLFLRKDLSSK